MVHMERNGSLFKTNVEKMSTLQNLKVHFKKERSKIFKVFKKIVIEKIWIKIRNEMHA